jgi:hypothetical protein
MEGWDFIYEMKRLPIRSSVYVILQCTLYYSIRYTTSITNYAIMISWEKQLHMDTNIYEKFHRYACASNSLSRCVSGLPFFRRSMLMPCPSSLRHISLGAGKPSALHVRVIFWFSRTATDDCVLLASRMLGGTAMIRTQVSSGWGGFNHVRTLGVRDVTDSWNTLRPVLFEMPHITLRLKWMPKCWCNFAWNMYCIENNIMNIFIYLAVNTEPENKFLLRMFKKIMH